MAKDRTARYDARVGASQPEVKHVLSAEFTRECEEYKESMQRSLHRAEINMMSSSVHRAEINMMSGSYRFHGVRDTEPTTDDSDVSPEIDHETLYIEADAAVQQTTHTEVDTASIITVSSPLPSLTNISPDLERTILETPLQPLDLSQAFVQVELDNEDPIDMGQHAIENEVQRLESSFCGLLQEQMTQFDLNSKTEFRLQLKDACEGHGVQIALENSMPACALEGRLYESNTTGLEERIRRSGFTFTVAEYHDFLHSSDSVDIPVDQDNDMPSLEDAGLSASDDSSEDSEMEEEPPVYLVDDGGGLTSLSQL